MIIAVDFDGTLSVSGKANLPLINRLKQEQRRGNIVILWTCRERERLAEAVLFLRQHGFVPNYINQNARETLKRFGHDTRKVYADVYIDDKEGTLWQNI